ncbi:MAG: hypothetical protein KC421_04175, partial [Anaerolineales bacterium]|nr:hypothetical protein [Anaerolineales bacterium]
NNDIVRFVPTSLGSNTAGTFELYFDGSDVDLNSSAERIEAIAFAPDGRLLISTYRSYNINGMTGKGSDILAFTPTSLGDDTSGAWELYFDGGDVGLSNQQQESVNGLWVDASNNELYLTTIGSFFIDPNFYGNGHDIFTCEASSLGDTTSCIFNSFWQGTDYGFNYVNIDALWIE